MRRKDHRIAWEYPTSLQPWNFGVEALEGFGTLLEPLETLELHTLTAEIWNLGMLNGLDCWNFEHPGERKLGTVSTLELDLKTDL